MLLRDFAVPHYIYVAVTVPRRRMMTSWASAAPSSGAKARKRACSGGGGGWAKHVAQGLCRSKNVTRAAEGGGFAICDLLLRPFNAVGSGRASEGLSPATTWGVARGAAQTSMQGTAVLWRRVTRGEVTRMIAEWDGGKRERERDRLQQTWMVLCSLQYIALCIWLAGRVKMYVMICDRA